MSLLVGERLHVPTVDSPRPPANWKRTYVAGLVILDGIAVVIGSLVAQFLRFETFDAAVKGPSRPISYVTMLLVVAPVWMGTLALCGVYDGRGLGNGSEEYRRILDAAVRFLAGVAILVLALRLSPGRGLVAMALPLTTVLTVVNHRLFRRWLHRQRALGHCMQRVLVVGTGTQVEDLVRHFRQASYAGFQVVGACIPDQGDTIVVDNEPVRVVGLTDDIIGAIHRTGADTVAVADHDQFQDGSLRRLGWEIEGTGTDLLVAPPVVDLAGPRISIRPVAGLPLLHVEEPRLTGFGRIGKCWCERLAAGVALIMLSPVFVVVALAVRCTSRGPALFKQTRLGQDGRPFVLYKFRTMRVDAETDLLSLAEHNEHDGPLFKMRDDPRVTPLGRRLRRLSIDELPQLWNVVTGHMSIVGPRPPLPTEVESFCSEARRRFLVKPGITGLWQISGRSSLPWQETVRLDMYYVENWSPALDLVILGKTLTAVLRRDGAY